jgi:hypothetical protein
MKLARAILTAVWLCVMVDLCQQALPGLPPYSDHEIVLTAAQTGSTHRLAEALQRKLDHIRDNSEQAHPDQTPTVMTEDELNDYLASGRVQLPQGVKKVTLQGRSGMVEGFVTVDFDELRAGQRSSNPLLSIFSGRHMVHIEGNASGSGGQGKVHVSSVAIDGIEVPRMALEFFVEKYITPKYPNVGIDSQFQLPNKIDTAVVGYHKLTVTQR